MNFPKEKYYHHYGPNVLKERLIEHVKKGLPLQHKKYGLELNLLQKAVVYEHRTKKKLLFDNKGRRPNYIQYQTRLAQSILISQ